MSVHRNSESFLAIFAPAIYNKITSDKRAYFIGGQHGLYKEGGENMYNRQLETFLRVADAGSFNKAAEVSYMTPTEVIKQINLIRRISWRKVI